MIFETIREGTCHPRKCGDTWLLVRHDLVKIDGNYHLTPAVQTDDNGKPYKFSDIGPAQFKSDAINRERMIHAKKEK